MAYSYSLSFLYVVYFCFLLMSILKGIKTKTLSNYASSQPEAVAYSPPPGKKHDVFVSFRGIDIRRGFHSHLMYAFSQNQIAVFVDDNIEKGKQISGAILEAIEGSLMSLIIFSQNYASSHWCLDELVKIFKCRDESKQIVLPVFYNVDPADVRHQRGTYERAFVKHKKRYSLIKLQDWRFALNECSNLAGFHSSNFRNDAELLEEIIKFELKKLNHLRQVNSNGLTGEQHYQIWSASHDAAITPQLRQPSSLHQTVIKNRIVCDWLHEIAVELRPQPQIN